MATYAEKLNRGADRRFAAESPAKIAPDDLKNLLVCFHLSNFADKSGSATDTAP